MSKVRLIGKNISFLAANRLVVAIVNFILFPFIIGHVGKEIYGVYLIVLSFTGYLALMDMGVMSALVKYVSEYRGKGDTKGMQAIVSASFSFYVLIGAIIGAVLILLSFFFTKFIHMSPPNVSVARQLFWVAGCTSFLVWPLSTFRGVIQGFSLWSVDALVSISTQILNALVTIIMLSNGFGIVQVFLFNQVFTILGSGYLYYLSRKNYGLTLIFPFIDMKVLKFIFNYSFFIFLSSLIQVFIFQIHNLVIGCMLSVSAVSIYAVAFNIQTYLRSINSILGAPPWTVASEMEGRKDIEGQRLLLFKGTKYMSAVFLPAIIIIFIFVEPFINYWVGPGFKDSVLPARILIVWWFFNGTAEIANGMLSARGIVKRPVYIQLATAAANVLIMLLFIKKWGIVAPALGLTIAMVFIGIPLTLRLSLRMLGVRFLEFFNRSVKVNLLYYCCVAAISWGFLHWVYPRGILATLLEMGTVYGVSVVFYYIIVLKAPEKNDMKKLIGLSVI